jgi:hypothetical protein
VFGPEKFLKASLTFTNEIRPFLRGESTLRKTTSRSSKKMNILKNLAVIKHSSLFCLTTIEEGTSFVTSTPEGNTVRNQNSGGHADVQGELEDKVRVGRISKKNCLSDYLNK